MPRLLGSLLLLIAVAGCSGDPNRAVVTGKVTLDGQPVEMGRIEFRPTEGNQGPTSGAVIKEGQYAVPAEGGVWVGKNRVEIRAALKTGRQVISTYTNQPEDERKEGIPARYNTESDLVREIKPGKNQLDFDLLSK